VFGLYFKINPFSISNKTFPLQGELEGAMYIIKVKGKAKIPDYIQLRDDSFVLIAYFRADRPLKNLEKYGLTGKETELQTLIAGLPFGQLQLLSL
jgi:hypothetical protein